MESMVLAVCSSPAHGFSKQPREAIELLAGRGVAGDVHCGAQVRHRSRVAADPDQPNLRQVHLLHAELLDELELQPGDLGENVTTRGLALLMLAPGDRLRLGTDATLRITGLRNPCGQIEAFRPGLLASVLRRRDDGNLERRAGIMAVVEVGGVVSPGDPIVLEPCVGPRQSLERV